MAIDPSTPKTVYAADYRGVFKSNLLSGNFIEWHACNNGLTGGVTALAIDSDVTSTLYAGAFGVFKTIDGGVSWNLNLTGLRAYLPSALAVDPQTPTTLYVGTDIGIFKSIDSGLSWVRFPDGPVDVRAVAIDYQNPSTVYAGSFSSGFFKSTDGGATWIHPQNFLTQLRVLVVDPQTPTTIYSESGGVAKSTDAGATWTRSAFLGLVYSLAIDPQTPTTLYAGTHNNGIFRSTNGGATWSTVNGTARVVQGLAIDPLTPSTLYAGSISDGVLKSTDAGASWTVSSTGLPNALVGTIVVDPNEPSNVYVATHDKFDMVGQGVFRSNNGGATWTTLNDGLTNFNITALTLDPQNPTTLYASVPGDILRITVTSVNNAPVANSQSVTTTEDNPIAITLTGSDVDGDSLTFTVTSSPTNGVLSGTAPNVTYTPDADYNGSDSFTFKVNDGSVDSGIATVSITINPVNDPPLPEANGPYTANEGSTITFDASGSSDVEGDPLQYRWDFDGDGLWDTEWSDSPTASHTWDDDWAGTAAVEVRDGEATATATATVTVNNVAPTVDAGEDQEVYPGDPVSFSGSFTDIGLLDTHEIEWDFGDGNSAVGTLTPTHTFPPSGTYTVTLTVTDDDGGVGSDTLTVIVKRIIVPIDIKPGSFPNSINPNSRGVIPVAILNDGTIDLALVDVSTVTFGPGGAGSVHGGHFEDVDKDGDDDLVLHFITQDSGIQDGDTSATLYANLTKGWQIMGEDTVRTVPPEEEGNVPPGKGKDKGK